MRADLMIEGFGVLYGNNLTFGWWKNNIMNGNVMIFNGNNMKEVIYGCF